ncbi:Glycosyltransferase involved in cell wall bisynthesis [Halopenitus malekzadehii]|uniref:Glycosyltransferase involved in cell wall bisynthesis n=1 Tax=Halopenitus malekzadehii TaxID=1267564 RepID=A0A1H6I9Y2_9EURY|nr:glycosyltransferase family 4 protein [Halopenitus malekzadehii]SEH45432.1 Glycosyltransferase involved in cell wall bisynthesis [Halopenitus malekzadehii]
MKIAHVYDEHYRVSPEKGSVAKVIYNLATAQVELGHDVTVLERQWSGLPQQEKQDGVQFTRFPLSIGSDVEGEEIPYKQIKSPTGILTMLFDRFELALKLRRHFRQTDYDIVHFHVPFVANILIHIYPTIRSRAAYTAHVGEEDIRFGLSREGLISYLLSIFSPDLHLMRRAAASSVLNERLAEELPLNDIEIIPNGVDVTEYTPENTNLVDVRSEFGIETPFVLFVGTITPRKGPDILLDAIKILDENGTIGEFSFVFAGNQEIEKEFTAELEERAENLTTEIHFPGFVTLEELKALYASCDIFTLPSHEEGMPMVVTEAMASKSPIVATNVSGIPEQVYEEENGYLVPPDDSIYLADKIGYLINDKDKRIQMGEKSRKFTIDEFSWESIAEKYLILYNSEII